MSWRGCCNLRWLFLAVLWASASSVLRAEVILPATALLVVEESLGEDVAYQLAPLPSEAPRPLPPLLLSPPANAPAESADTDRPAAPEKVSFDSAAGDGSEKEASQPSDEEEQGNTPAKAEPLPAPRDDGDDSEKPTEKLEEVAPAENADDETEPAPAAEVIPLEVSDDWYLVLWNGWEHSFELGFNGSSGNSETHNWRVGFDSVRTTEWSKLTLDTNYRKARQDSRITANRFFFDWRYEWNFDESPWTTFIHGTVEFDEFRAFDVRVTDDAGIGYEWFHTPQGKLITRAGAGAAREFGGPQDKYVPEGVLGMNYERKLTDRQKLSASAEYFFDWTDWTEIRVNAKASWQVILDDAWHTSLKLSVSDRYDSTPNGSEPNDVDYSAVLLWKF